MPLRQKASTVDMLQAPSTFQVSSMRRAMIHQHLGRDRDALADLDKVFSSHADDETDATALASRAELRASSSDPSV
jgi:hypothetical protein